MTAELHPSYLELDRYSLAAPLDASTATHVAKCARCRAYLDAAQHAGATPAWLALASSRGHKRVRAWAYLTGGLAAAAIVCLVWLGRAPSAPPYDGVKGGPSVGVYVQRESVVRLWDGGLLRPGDRIRLEVLPDLFDHVSVFSLPPRAAPVRLYSGRVMRKTRNVLPKAWQLDAAEGPEQLAIFLSDAEISVHAAEVLLKARDPDQVWLTKLTLPKQGSQH